MLLCNRANIGSQQHGLDVKNGSFDELVDYFLSPWFEYKNTPRCVKSEKAIELLKPCQLIQCCVMFIKNKNPQIIKQKQDRKILDHTLIVSSKPTGN